MLLWHNLLTEEMCWREEKQSHFYHHHHQHRKKWVENSKRKSRLTNFKLSSVGYATFHHQALSSSKQTTEWQHEQTLYPFHILQPNQCTQSNIISDGWNVCNRTTNLLSSSNKRFHQHPTSIFALFAVSVTKVIQCSPSSWK